MTDELKACLRCSSIAVDAWITQELVFRQATIKPHGIVACFDCQTEVNAPTVEMAIKKWNSRPIEDALRAELAQARAELAEMKSANTRTYCAYCGEGILLNEDAPEKVEAHIRACEKHPYHMALARIAELEAENAKTCDWQYEECDSYWSSSCGLDWVLEDEGPKENDMEFCPRCGKRIVILPTPPQESPDD